MGDGKEEMTGSDSIKKDEQQKEQDRVAQAKDADPTQAPESSAGRHTGPGQGQGTR